MTQPAGTGDLLRKAVAWGGEAWLSQVATGLQWVGDLRGRRLLEIGARYGAMAVYFAECGAHVTGVDVDGRALDRARERAVSAGVAHLTDFQPYSGLPADLPNGFDVVFTKSTLVLVDDLESMVAGIAESLVPGGRLLAVENGAGPWPFRIARMIRWLSLHPYGARYFTRESVATIGAYLDIEVERWTSMPPTVVIGARKNG